MKEIITYIGYIGLMLAISLMANLAQAQDICETELKPFYNSLANLNQSASTKKRLISIYHARKKAVYSICDSERVRQFESDYVLRVINKDKSQVETVGYYPKARQTVDLGEVEVRRPASRSY